MVDQEFKFSINFMKCDEHIQDLDNQSSSVFTRLTLADSFLSYPNIWFSKIVISTGKLKVKNERKHECE